MKNFIVHTPFYFLLILILFTCHFSMAQECTITRIALNGDQLTIFYDLNDTVPDRLYSIKLFSSHNAYKSDMLKVNGDVGLEIKPGKIKKIIWNIGEELGAEFKGELALQIRGKIYTPFIQLDSFPDTRFVKRGKLNTIKWEGGSENDRLSFVLYQNNEMIEEIGTIGNIKKEYKFKIPVHVKPGEGYRLLVHDTKKTDKAVQTEVFEVKRKVSRFWKYTWVIAGGIGIYLLATLPDGGKTFEIADAPCPDGTDDCNK